MTIQPQDSTPGPGKTTGAEEPRSWPVALLVGAILGAVVAIIAAILRRTPGLRPVASNGERRLPPEDRVPPEVLAPQKAPSSVSPARDGGRLATGGLAASVSEAEAGAPVTPDLVSKTPTPAPVAGPPKPVTPSPSPSTRWREPTKYVVGVGLFLAAVFVVFISRSVIPIIIVAALLALVVHPIIGFMQRRLKLSRGLSIALIYLLIIALLVLIPLVVVPNVISAINDLLNIDFQGLAQDGAQALENLSARVAQIPVLNVLLGPLLDSLATALQGISAVETPEAVSYRAAMGGIVERLAHMLGTVAKVLGPIVSAVLSLVFMLLISFHLSLVGDRILGGYSRLLPPSYEPELSDLVQRIGGVWTSFLRGQLALMVIVGVIVWLGNAILGNQAPLLLGVISGTLEIIPNLGPALALIPGVGMALIFGSSHFALPNLTFALLVLAFYLLVQVVENQLIVPYVLGGELDVPPLVVIIGVMVGGTVAGILGVLLATPIIATGREVFSYLYNKILESPEVEGRPEDKPSLLDSVRNRLREVRLPFGRRRAQRPVPDQERGPTTPEL